MDGHRIYGVIVTYNRKELLLKNLLALNNQTRKLDKIVVVDNHSSDGTYDYIKSNLSTMDNIEYIYLEDNIGGAGGFYTGIKYAYESLADWIYVMDDDGRPYNSLTIEELIKKIDCMNLSSEEMIIANSLVVCKEGELTFRNKNVKTVDEIVKTSTNGIIYNKTQLFNGSLFSNGLVKKIGFPNKDFFIKGDEVDFRRRAVNEKALLFTVVDSLYFHPDFPEVELKFLGIKKYHICIESPWKEYYTVRNTTYSLYQYNKKIKAYLFYLKRVISAKKIKMKNLDEVLTMMKKGFLDGKKGNLGATVRP